MSKEEQATIIGQLVMELDEKRKLLVCLRRKAEQLGDGMLVGASFLKSSGPSEETAASEMRTYTCPDPQEVESLLNQICDAAETVRELRCKLDEFGIRH